MLHREIRKIVMPLALAALLAPVAWSRPSASDGEAVVKMLHTHHSMLVNGTSVQPGEYRLIAKGDKLKIENMDNKVVAESPITWRHLRMPALRTSTDVDRGVLTKVTLGGTHQAVLLHRSR